MDPQRTEGLDDTRTRLRVRVIIARTNPDVPKHKGITAFLVDMRAPGVEVLPLYQSTGEAEFNECFFNDVRVPDLESTRRCR